MLSRCLHSGSSETSQISIPCDPYLTECDRHSLHVQGRHLRVLSGSFLSHAHLSHHQTLFSYKADPSSIRFSPLHCGGQLQDPIISHLAWAGVFLGTPPPPPSHLLRSQAESDHTAFLLESAFLPAANRKEAKILNLVCQTCALLPLPPAGTTLLLAAWAPRSPWDQQGPLSAPTCLQGRAPIAYPSHSLLSSALRMLARSS